MISIKKYIKTGFLFILLGLLAIACNQKDSTKTAEQPVADIELVYHVEGMTCDHCEMSIQKGVSELEGIVEIEANHEDSTTRIVYNPSKTDPDEITAAIEKRGYQVIK